MILQKREKIILFICIATAIVAVLYSFLVEPFCKKWSATGDELKVKQTLLEKSRALLSQKEILAVEFKKIQKVSHVSLTSEEYAAKLLLQLENVGRQSQIKQITRVSPLPIKEEKEYQLLQIQLHFETEIVGLVKYLYNLQNNFYPVTIERLQIDTNSEDPRILRTEMVISSMYFKSGENK